MSLRRRVMLGVVAVVAVLVVANVTLAATFHSFLRDRTDQQLVGVADSLINRRTLAFPGPSSSAARNRARATDTFSEFYIGVVADGGKVLHRLGAPLDERRAAVPRLVVDQLAAHERPTGAALAPFSASSKGGGSGWRVVVVHNQPTNETVVVAISEAEMDATLARIHLVLILATVAVLGALAAVSWWVLRQGVRPLADIARTAGTIAAGDLSQRVANTDERTEAGRLGVALNAMLEQIEVAFAAGTASEQRLRRFAADASHELRTPLTSIQGYAELWRAGALRAEDDLAEAMRRMELEARRMATLVEELLLLARLDQNRALERAPVRLDAIVADAVRDARATEPDRPIDMQLEPAVVLGDDARMRQVLANLLTNARMHTPAGTPVHVTVTITPYGARLVVADDGRGLEPEVAEQMFERFFRADPGRARTGSGSGLGLAIVAAIVEAHNGRVAVETAPGAGTRFIVELPTADERRTTMSEPAHAVDRDYGCDGLGPSPSSSKATSSR